MHFSVPKHFAGTREQCLVRIFVQTEPNESWLSIAEVQPKMGFSPKGGQERGKENIVQGEKRAKLV
jgi:hypothetical protein